mmetsp:Transcript_27689/g.65754  ORF Transcript_27689/g.65754 Transcript_27689/m.65754 type:complete len:226 (+) Transcript_27689:123-800(+)
MAPHQRGLHHSLDRRVRLLPRLLHIPHPQLPHRLLQRPQQRLAHNRKVLWLHTILRVPRSERIEHRDQRLDVRQACHSVADGLHHARRVLLHAGALLERDLVLEAEELQRGRGDLEDAKEELDPVRLEVLGHQPPGLFHEVHRRQPAHGRGRGLAGCGCCCLPLCDLSLQHWLHHALHCPVRLLPRIFHLRGPQLPKSLLQRPQQRLANNSKVLWLDSVFGVPPP